MNNHLGGSLFGYYKGELYHIEIALVPIIDCAESSAKGFHTLYDVLIVEIVPNSSNDLVILKILKKYQRYVCLRCVISKVNVDLGI